MTSTVDSTPTKAHSQDSVPSFIRKTYDILEEARFPDIISWNEEGNALVIKKALEFSQKVLPSYFKHSNLTSFVRQLNMYNFHKKRTQNHEHIYYHELFQQGQKHLLKEIRRKNRGYNDEKVMKPLELCDPSSQNQDIPSLVYENQMLKRLYTETMAKLTTLETEIQEIDSQNKLLWDQIHKSSEPQQTFMPYVADEQNNQDQLNQENIKMEDFFVKQQSVGGFFNLNDEHSNENESTEISQSTPIAMMSLEEKYLELTEAIPSTQNQEFSEQAFPPLCLDSADSQFQLQSFDPIYLEEEILNQRELAQLKTQYTCNKPSSLLGKRSLEDVSVVSYQACKYEPSFLSRRKQISDYEKNVKTEECEFGLDLMNFNMGF